MDQDLRIILVPGVKLEVFKLNSKVLKIISEAFIDLNLSFKILDDSIKEVFNDA